MINNFEEFKEYTKEELVEVAYIYNNDWQKEAVIYAKELLNDKNISKDEIIELIASIHRSKDKLNDREIESRKYKSYSIFDLVFMTLFWIKYIFTDWGLKKEGYLRKSKQRIIAISIGVLVFLYFIVDTNLNSDKDYQEKIDKIEQIAKADSIIKANIDWSGDYVFEDTITNNGIRKELIWKVEIRKKLSEHDVVIVFSGNDINQRINCVGVIRDNTISILPDTSYTLFNNQLITYYDKLIKFKDINNKIYTEWLTLEPVYYRGNKGLDLFKRYKVDIKQRNSITECCNEN